MLGFQIDVLFPQPEIKGRYQIYCDEEAMFKQDRCGGVNQLGNPLIAERHLMAMRFGGPLGPLAVIKKGGHSRKELIELFRAQDKRTR